MCPVCTANAFEMILVDTLNAELNPICHLLALLGAHHILHASSIRVKPTFDDQLSDQKSYKITDLFHMLHAK
jgi:hypothetical protein